MKMMRRRGKALEKAILDAAYDIIETSGYDDLTFQRVAKQAQTSRTVIYRRYETPVDLLHALVLYKSTQALGGRMDDLFRDQGSLRADLLAVVNIYQRFFDAVGPKLLGAVLTEFSRNYERFRAWSEQARNGHLKIMKKVEEYAKRRGEIAHDFTEMQMSLPFDLLRAENIIRHEKITNAYLNRLVDEVLLPVFLRKS
jgi:AcrR family transcriptional regulator